MFRSALAVVLILFSVFPVLFLQQIFENYPKCKYIMNSTLHGNKNENVELQDKLWEITGFGSWSDWKILFSPCGTSIPPTINCSPEAVVCLVNSKHPKKSVQNAGKSFLYTLDENYNGVLQSLHGQRCEQGNYTVTIIFECLPNTMVTPSILSIDGCKVYIRMMNPDCKLPCTLREGGYLIDLRPLQRLPSLVIEEPVTGRSFRLSFCKASSECGVEVSACELLSDGNINPISNVESHIVYNRITNNLIVKGHSGSRTGRQNLEIDITCKWNEGKIASINYIAPMTQGRKHKFKAESSLACIKLPINCLVKDSTDNDFVYDLSNLNKKTGWKVGNVTDGSIYLNVCGPLVFSFQDSICNDQHSQVCLTTATNEHINLGSIPTNFHITDDKVKGTFKDGSVCAVNNTYTTEIEFICAKIDKGPLIQAVNNCSYKIKWETPNICPKYVVTADDNCVISDLAGIVNLNAIHTASDRKYTINETSFLRYNLCGKLNSPCSHNNHTSVCYIKDGIEYVVGLSSKILSRDDKSLSLNLIGDICSNGKISKTRIDFHCNHSAPEEGRVIVNNEDSGCLFEINIYTPLACTQAATTECKFYNNNIVYNLNPLSRPDGDYIIKNDLGTSYIINICRSLTNKENSLCPSFSGACLHNTTEPHLKYKYLSLGKVNKGLAFENGNLVIFYTHGSRCAGNELFHSTTIKFYCSTNEEGPRLSDRKTCSHEFIWHTPHACPEHTLALKKAGFTNSVCEYTDPHTHEQIDFSTISNKLLNISTRDGSSLVFNLCDKNYTHCTTNGASCKFINSTAQLLSDQTGLYLEYRLENECLSQDHANRLHIHLLCDTIQNNKHFKFTKIWNCVFHINLITSLACRFKEGKTNLIDEKPLPAFNEVIKQSGAETNNVSSSILMLTQSTQQSRTENVNKNTNVEKIKYDTRKIPLSFVEKVVRHNCSVKANNLQMDLMTIQPTNIISPSGTEYTLNLNGNVSACNGYICKNGSVVISEANNCPVVQFDNTQNVIKLLYSGYRVCDSGYHSEVWLKCDALSNEQPKIFMESKCHIKALYPLKDACLLLMLPQITNSTTEIAIGSSIGLVVMAAAIIGLYIVIKKRSPNMCSRSCYQEIREDKERVAVYIKDTKI